MSRKSRRDLNKSSASGNQSFMTKLRNMEEETSWTCQCNDCQLTMPKRLRNRSSSVYSRSTGHPTTETSLSKTSFSSYCDEETCCIHNRPCALKNNYKWDSDPSSHTIYENISPGTSFASLPPPPSSRTASQSSAYDSNAVSCRSKSRNGCKKQSFTSSCFLNGSKCADGTDTLTDADVFHDNSLVFLRDHVPKIEDDTKTLFENKTNVDKKKNKSKALLTLIELDGCESDAVRRRHGRKREVSKIQPTEVQPLSVKEIFDLTEPKAGSKPASDDYENIGAIPLKESTLECESSKTKRPNYENVEFADKHMPFEKEFPLSRKQSLRLHSTPLLVENSKDLDKKRANDLKDDQLEKLQKEHDVKIQELKQQLEAVKRNEAKALDEVEKYKLHIKESYQALKSIVIFGSNLI